MELYVTENYEEMSRKTANIISAQIIMKPDSVLGLATGSTPIGTYKQLIDWYRKGDLDFSKVRAVNLDEYKGLDKNNEQSYAYFMKQNLFENINIDTNKVFIPNGKEEDSDKACKEYDETIANLGGIDLQLLGLGHNGHIGFNEPSEYFEKGTHCVKLSKTTIEANARFFRTINEVPTQAYTMGIKSIMMAKKIVVVVSGEDKADITNKAFFEKVTAIVPASILQLHPNVSLIADVAALSKVTSFKKNKLGNHVLLT